MENQFSRVDALLGSNNLEKLTDLEDNNNDISEKENFSLENKIILKNVEMPKLSSLALVVLVVMFVRH